MLGLVSPKVWLVWNYATSANKCQHCCGSMQTDATCRAQQCWVLLANNVASVCMGLNVLIYIHVFVAKFPYKSFRWLCYLLVPLVVGGRLFFHYCHYLLIGWWITKDILIGLVGHVVCSILSIEPQLALCIAWHVERVIARFGNLERKIIIIIIFAFERRENA